MSERYETTVLASKPPSKAVEPEVHVCTPECLERVARTLEVMGQMLDRKIADLHTRIDGLEKKVSA